MDQETKDEIARLDARISGIATAVYASIFGISDRNGLDVSGIMASLDSALEHLRKMNAPTEVLTEISRLKQSFQTGHSPSAHPGQG